MSEFKRIDNETFQDYLVRIGSEYKKYGWNKLGDVFNAITGSNYSSDAWRKWYAKEINENYKYPGIKSFIDFVSDDIYDKKDIKVQELQRELERMKIKFRDQRNAWNKQNYIDARIEETLELLEEKMLEVSNLEFPALHMTKSADKSDSDMLVMLSDFHIGQCFSSKFGDYNTNIAADRLGQLLNRIIEIQKIHKSENCQIVLLGDMLSGNIHKTIQVTNKENVIDQIKIATQLISSFSYELSKHFKNVYLNSIVGNHTRLDLKEDALHDERLDDIITWGVELSLNNVENFHIVRNNLDSGICTLNIRDNIYVGVHGDYDMFNDKGVSKLVTMIGFIPYAVLFGHLHTCALNDVNGIKLIRGGSLAGSGDQYTIEKRITGRPSQMVCICTNDGVSAYYPIELK